MHRMGSALWAGLALTACAHGQLRLDALPPTISIGAVDRYGTDSLTIEPGGEIVSFALAERAEIALVAVTSGGRVSVLYPYAPGESSQFTAGPHALVVPVSLEWAADPSGRAPATAATEMEALRAYNRCLATWRPRRASRTTASRAPGDTSSQREAPPSVVEERYSNYFSSDAEACGLLPVSSGSAPGQPGAWRPRDDVVVLVVSSTPFTAERLRQRVLGLRVRSEADLRALPLWIVGDRSLPWAGYYSRRLPSRYPQEMR
jgi:hypothetical protein